MNEYLDEFDYHMHMVESCLNACVEIDPFLEIFEAKKPEVQKQQVNNQQNTASSASHLQKAFDALKKFFNSIVTSISNFISKLFMSKEEKAKFEAFKQKCAQDPNLKNKKITVATFRQYEGEYKKLMADAQKAADDLVAGREAEDGPIISRLKEFGNKIGNAAKAAAVTVGIDAACNYASGNQSFAQLASFTLRSQSGAMEQLENVIGKKAAKATVKELDKLSRAGRLRRWIMETSGKVCHTTGEAFGKTMDELKKLSNGVEKVIGDVNSGNKLLATRHAVGIAANNGIVKRGLIKGTTMRQKLSAVNSGRKAAKTVKNVKNQAEFAVNNPVAFGVSHLFGG